MRPCRPTLGWFFELLSEEWPSVVYGFMASFIAGDYVCVSLSKKAGWDSLHGIGRSLDHEPSCYQLYFDYT